ncbi:hypothetical protein KCU87_g4, partial [Aureobasidium melanogenum]
MYVYTFSSALQELPKSMTRTSARRGSQRSMFSGLRSQWIILLDCSRHKQASIWRAKRRMSWSENPEKLWALMNS